MTEETVKEIFGAGPNMTVREKSLRITKQPNGNKKDCRKGSLFLLF